MCICINRSLRLCAINGRLRIQNPIKLVRHINRWHRQPLLLHRKIKCTNNKAQNLLSLSNSFLFVRLRFLAVQSNPVPWTENGFSCTKSILYFIRQTHKKPYAHMKRNCYTKCHFHHVLSLLLLRCYNCRKFVCDECDIPLCRHYLTRYAG